MLIRVEAYNSQGTVLNLPLGDVSSGIFVKEIEGLDPVKANLASSSFANKDGEQYHAARREARNLKFKLNLRTDNASATVQSLRSYLYSFFMPKSEVLFRFHMTDGFYVDILGRVETCEAPLFVKEPAVDISILCFDPDFYSPTPVIVNASTSNAGYVEILIPYAGTVESGYKFTLNANRSVSEYFDIHHRGPDNVISVLTYTVSPTINSGESLEIVTITGKKSVRHNVQGGLSSSLRNLTVIEKWPELRPGDNYIRVYAPGAAIPYTIEYVTKYGGL